jgi:hypothetical protein
MGIIQTGRDQLEDTATAISLVLLGLRRRDENILACVTQGTLIIMDKRLNDDESIKYDERE